MMTSVYSRSRVVELLCCSSCRAPRMPPSGFLISCARLRMSSRLACWPVQQPARDRRAAARRSGGIRAAGARQVSTGVTVQSSCSGFGVAALHADVLAGVAPVGARALSSAAARLRAAEQAFERLAEQFAPADREQVLRARVEVADHQPGVDEHDRRRQQVESGERAAGAAGGGVGAMAWARPVVRSRTCKKRARSGSSQAGDLPAQCIDIALVQFDAVLEWAHAFEHLLVVALVAETDGFLLGERLLCLGQLLPSVRSSSCSTWRRASSRPRLLVGAHAREVAARGRSAAAGAAGRRTGAGTEDTGGWSDCRRTQPRASARSLV